VASAVADVTDRDGCKKTVSYLADRVGPVDVLVANAGIGLRTSALNFQAAEIEAQVRVNLLGVANSIEAVLPSMLARKTGHLVAISSLASFRGLPSMAGYCASKAGVNAMMDALRIELREQGIAVSTICPGFIRTPLTLKFAGRFPMMELDEACQCIMAAIRRRQSFCAFPRTPKFRLRLLRWLPTAWSDWLASKYARRYLTELERAETK
jgi:short-subunit dehydrogenase